MDSGEFSLNFKNKNLKNQTLIFVKLTESSLKSIEKSIETKNSSSAVPTIQFKNNGGILNVPVNGSNQSYEFKLSNIEPDRPQGSFECLRQNGHRSLESLGCMMMKLTINANEDSYEKTKLKIAAAEQEHKKLCTKEIKANNRIGKKIQVNHPSPAVSSYPSSSVHRPFFRPNFSEVSRQPIRERIIQVLAFKPYKKAELLLRLKKEGLTEKDKDKLNNILVEVSNLKGNILLLQNNLWSEVKEEWSFYSKEEKQIIKRRKQQILKAGTEPENKNATSGVSKNEKGLPNKKSFHHQNNTDEDRMCVVKNSSSEKVYGRSKNCFVKQQSDDNHVLKNAPSDFDFINKNLDINKNEKSLPNKKCFDGIQDEIHPHIPNSATCSTLSSSENYSLVGNTISRNTISSKLKLYKTILVDSSPPRKSMPEKGKKNNGGKEVILIDLTKESAPELDFSEIQQKYTEVKSEEQRKKYFDDFHADYEEYFTLFTEMNKNSDVFANLNNKLNAVTEGSLEYERIKKEIYQEYKKVMKGGHNIRKKRFEFLKAKLNHIREQVRKFDEDYC